MYRVALFVVFVLATSFGCGDGRSGTAGQTTSSAGPSGAVYLARPDDHWNLKEAYNPLPEHTLTRTVEPSLDWYAEYEAPAGISPRRVRLSGHSGGVDEVAGELKGFSFEPAKVGAYDGRAGVSSEADGPSAVVFGVRPGYSMVVLSYELQIDDLERWSEDLKVVSESEWTQAGGKVDRG